MREALTLVGLPSEMLLRHGNQRIVYGVPLARNFRRVLLGLETRPKYIVAQSNPRKKTVMIGAYWINRWLSKRIEQDSVLMQVASHSLAYPVRHGAQVKVIGDQIPEILKVMATTMSSAAVG
jgi:hypothetical protein